MGNKIAVVLIHVVCLLMGTLSIVLAFHSRNDIESVMFPIFAIFIFAYELTLWYAHKKHGWDIVGGYF